GLHALEAFDFRGRIGDAPVDVHALRARGAVGNKAQLEPADRISDVERLVEVWLLPEELRIPSLASLEIGDRVDGGAQALDHVDLRSSEVNWRDHDAAMVSSEQAMS